MSGQTSGDSAGSRTPPPRRSQSKGGRPTPRPATRSAASGAGPKSGGAKAGGGGTGGGRKAAPKRRAWYLKPTALVPVALVVVAAVVIVAVTSGGGGTKTTTAVGYKTGTLAVYGAVGPEGIPIEASAVLAPPNPALSSAPIDGVQCGATEQLTVHYHTHLQIFVNGQPRAVPLAVGMVPPAILTGSGTAQFAQGSNTCLFWIHTHAQDGIIHIEAPSNRQYVLSQFFDIWGQTLSPTQVGPAHGAVTVTIDGKAYTGDPRNAVMGSHSQIVLNVGTPIVTPPPVSFSGTGL